MDILDEKQLNGEVDKIINKFTKHKINNNGSVETYIDIVSLIKYLLNNKEDDNIKSETDRELFSHLIKKEKVLFYADKKVSNLILSTCEIKDTISKIDDEIIVSELLFDIGVDENSSKIYYRNYKYAADVIMKEKQLRKICGINNEYSKFFADTTYLNRLLNMCGANNFQHQSEYKDNLKEKKIFKFYLDHNEKIQCECIPFDIDLLSSI